MFGGAGGFVAASKSHLHILKYAHIWLEERKGACEMHQDCTFGSSLFFFLSAFLPSALPSDRHKLWNVFPSSTGWQFCLFTTSSWNWFESSVLVKGPYTKTQLSNQCQREVLNKQNCRPVLTLHRGWGRWRLNPKHYEAIPISEFRLNLYVQCKRLVCN